MDNINEIRDKLFLSLDPNSGYSHEDFLKEFPNNTISTTATIDPDVYKVKLKFINNSKNEDPKYEKEGDSGFDLRANISEPIVLEKGKTILVPTGIHIDLERGKEAHVRSRSGLAAKNNIFVLNSPGTIDYAYTSEIKVILTNLGENDFIITNGLRIAQIVICPVLSEHFVKLVKVDKFDTDKNRGGFGSTGLD